jgi:hypothetical protein
MLERLLNWMAARWVKPVRWDIRTDDRQVRHHVSPLARRIQALGQFRAWQYVPTLTAPVRPAWVRPEADVSVGRELRVSPMFEGNRLYAITEPHKARMLAQQLAEKADRIADVAEKWWSELVTEVGAPSQGWAT